MTHPRHERLDSTSSSTPLLPVSRSGSFFEAIVSGKLEEDDSIWKDYVDAARTFDNNMIDEWNKFLDVTLVFICLFIAVLTSFIIETLKSLKPDHAEVTNKILVLMFNKLSNSSSGQEPLDFANITRVGKEELSEAISYNGLLFVSLALSIAVSIISMSAKLWLVQYISWVREPGSNHDRAMKRQKAYSGMQRWKLHRVIDSLPLWTLIAVFLFGIFIHQTIRDHNPKLGYIIGVIFLIGLTFFVLASCSAAFLDSLAAPFHSPFSHFIAWVSRKLLPKHRKWQLFWIIVSSSITAIMTIFLVAYKGTICQLLIFCPIVGVFAVAEKEPEKSGEYSPLYGPPELVVFGGFTLFIPIAVALYVDTTRDPGRTIYIAVSSVGVGLLALYGYSMNRLTQKVPDTLEVEAVAWLLEVKEPESVLFEKASRIADTPQHKALLLKTLLPLLPHLISRAQNLPGELKNRDLQMLLSRLAHLLKFPHETKQSRWQNKAAVKRPKFPKKLRGQLRKLTGVPDPRLRGAAETICCDHGTLFEGEKTGDKA